MPTHPLSLLRIPAILAVVCLSFALTTAQHDTTGGSTAGGGALGGPTKPSTKPTTKTPSRTTTPATRKPTAAGNPRRVVPKAPTADSYVKQGDEQYDEKNYADALQSYLKAIQLNPSLAEANYRIGWIYNEQNQYQQALTYLDRSLQLNSNNAAAHAERGYAYRKLKRYSEALAAYQQAIAIKSWRSTSLSPWQGAG